MMKQIFLTFFIFISCFLLFNACQYNNVTIRKDWEKYFNENGYQGCIGLYKNANGNFNIYNLKGFRDTAYAMNNSLALFLNLILIDKGILNNEEESKLSLNSNGFENKLLLKFNNISLNDWKKYADSIHFGLNLNHLPSIDSLAYMIKLTPDEQLGFLKKLYFKQLPFQLRTQERVKKQFIQHKILNKNITYTYFTTDKKPYDTWCLGWIEENNRVELFVLNFRAHQPINLTKINNLLKFLFI